MSKLSPCHETGIQMSILRRRTLCRPVQYFGNGRGYGLSDLELQSYKRTSYTLQTLPNNLYTCNWFKFHNVCEITVYKDNIWPVID